MMTRRFVLALLGVALLCGLVAGQDEATGEDKPSRDAASTPKKDPSATTASDAAGGDEDADASPEPEPESEPEPEPEHTAEEEEEQTAKQEASSSDDNGAALVSVSLPTMVLATVLAKVYAH